MYYAPHKLYKKVELIVRDDLNRITSSGSHWELVGPCRCDDNTTQKFEDQNGRIFIPKYKIVCERANVTEGDMIQCLCEDGTVRGEGRVYNAPQCNCLNYMVVYV
jgi:hypothetical protein